MDFGHNGAGLCSERNLNSPFSAKLASRQNSPCSASHPAGCIRSPTHQAPPEARCSPLQFTSTSDLPTCNLRSCAAHDLDGSRDVAGVHVRFSCNSEHIGRSPSCPDDSL